MTIEAIHQIVEHWRRAELDGNADRLSEIFYDDFIGVRPRGFVLNKAAWLVRYRSGDLKNTAFELADLSVRTFGSIAIVVGIQTQQAASRGRDASGRFRTTVVLHEREGTWFIVHLQLSPIAY